MLPMSVVGQVREEGVYLMAGWSDKIFEVLEALEAGETVLSEVDKQNL